MGVDCSEDNRRAHPALKACPEPEALYTLSSFQSIPAVTAIEMEAQRAQVTGLGLHSF